MSDLHRSRTGGNRVTGKRIEPGHPTTVGCFGRSAQMASSFCRPPCSPLAQIYAIIGWSVALLGAHWQLFCRIQAGRGVMPISWEWAVNFRLEFYLTDVAQIYFRNESTEYPTGGTICSLRGCKVPSRRLEYALLDAGWSSLAARRAHNPKVVGSNPTPATNLKITY